MGETAASADPRTNVDNRNMLPLGLIIVFGIFASTMPQPQALGKLPLQFLLKNNVHVTREQMAAFFFWCGLAWHLKPFAGILTDARGLNHGGHHDRSCGASTYDDWFFA